MKRLAIIVAILVGLGVAAMLTAKSASASYCKTVACGLGGTQQICCNEPDPNNPTATPLPIDPNNPSGGIKICGAIDDLVGGCVQLPPGTIAGCVATIGLSLTGLSPPDPNNLPMGPPPCDNIAVDACQDCGCATASACQGGL